MPFNSFIMHALAKYLCVYCDNGKYIFYELENAKTIPMGTRSA